MPARQGDATRARLFKVRAQAIEVMDRDTGFLWQDTARALWTELLEGRWNVVEAFGVHRFHLILRPGDSGARALNPREIEVARRLAAGEIIKGVAHDLSMGASRVSECLTSTMQKLGVTARPNVLRLFCQFGEGGNSRRQISGARFEVDAKPFAVLVTQHSLDLVLEDLSEAENNVCAQMLAGVSNSDIAKSRGVSVNTVENQISSLYRKLGVSSRLTLSALVWSHGAMPR